MNSALIAYGNFLFKHRNWIFPVVTIICLFLIPPQTLMDGAPGIISNIAGLLIVLAGAAVRISVVGLAYIKRGGIDRQVAADTLVTEGIFAHCRNPLYVGNLLIVAGYALIHGGALTIALLLGFFITAYIAIVAAEENFLKNKFGTAYDEYAARVPRWGFRLAGLKETFASMEFSWKRVMAKEYTTIDTWFITVIALTCYESILMAGLNDSMPIITLSVFFLILTQAATLTIRHYKKSGRFAGA